jgi:hypothetical protein
MRTVRAERFDVDVAGAHFNSQFKEIVDRAHHRRAARKIPQALDVIVTAWRRDLFL